MYKPLIKSKKIIIDSDLKLIEPAESTGFINMRDKDSKIKALLKIETFNEIKENKISMPFIYSVGSLGDINSICGKIVRVGKIRDDLLSIGCVYHGRKKILYVKVKN